MTMKETASLLPKKDKQFQAHHQLIPLKLMRINHLLAGIGISFLSIASGGETSQPFEKNACISVENLL